MKKRIAIIGLGYVGLPLAVEFGKSHEVIGFDLSDERINELRGGYDRTRESSSGDLEKAVHLSFTTNPEDLKDCEIFIITVPTPIDAHKRPDLKPLASASKTVGRVLSKDNIVIYESTVFPGCTEDFCVPILEESSKLKFNEDFYCGYSPERINPGDKEHTVRQILKVTSGSTPRTADLVNELYSSIIKAGTYQAESIKVAEAAKVIENTQRDLNIAFVNELAIMFEKMGLDTHQVLNAAGTKWNFLPFKPGLVGGHCIGVDPYYLTYKAQEFGYNPEIILAGRRLNDNMGSYVAEQVVKGMIHSGHKILGAKVLVLGITFKENCPDIRNSRVIDVINNLKSFGCDVEVHDPWADSEEVRKEYSIELCKLDRNKRFNGVVLAVSHSEYKELEIKDIVNHDGFIYDVKGFYPINKVNKRL